MRKSLCGPSLPPPRFGRTNRNAQFRANGSQSDLLGAPAPYAFLLSKNNLNEHCEVKDSLRLLGQE